MNDVKSINLLDAGIEKPFVIRKMKAMELFKYTNKVVSTIAATEKIKPEMIRDLLNGAMKTGISSGKTTDEDVQTAFAEGGIMLAFDVVMNVFSGLTDEKQIELLEPLIGCVTFLNPTPMQLTTDLLSDYTIDNYVKDFLNIYKLAYAVLEFNVGHFFPKAEKTSS
jgi:hypothetical protein